MTEESITSHILENLAGIHAVEADGNTFFFYDPAHLMPLATLVTNDRYDKVSDLSRPGVFRLNIGRGVRKRSANCWAMPSVRTSP